MLSGVPGQLCAQAQWDARLDVTPFPSPYLSDWEANPTIATLTITNPTGVDQNVVLVYHVTEHGGRMIASGRSDPVFLARGPPTILTDFINLSGSSQHDRSLEDQMRRTGRLPEGDHTACVAVTDPGGFVLAEDCVTFSIVYPDPPYLIGPMDEEALTSGHPIFQWTPLQVPPAFVLTYLVRVSEVLPAQTPAQALVANIPVFEATTFSTHLEYPITAPTLVEGKAYAWRVQALDQSGYAASGNEGRSEIWTFRHEPGGGVGPEEPAGPYRASLTFFDPDDDLPELLAMLDSTDFPRFADYLIEQGQAGTLDIPIPLPGFEALAQDENRRSGLGGGADLPAAACPAALRDLDVSIRVDRVKKSAGIMFTLDGGLLPLLGCLGVERWSRPIEDHAGVLFAVDWGHGLPRVTLGLKPNTFDLGEDRLHFDYAVFILNLLGDFTLYSEHYPDAFADFYGSEVIEVWGTGVIDLGAKVVDVIRQRSKKSGLALAGQVGMNLYAVLNLGVDFPEITSYGISDDAVTLRGFRGFREKTYRGISLGAARNDSAAIRDDQRIRDRWFLTGSIPAGVPSWMDFLVKEHRFEIEIGAQDSATGHIGLRAGENDTMYTRRRIVFRDVLGGFDVLKDFLGVPSDSTIEFYSELKIETTGREGAWFGGPDATISWGIDGTFKFFNGAVHLYDPKLTIGRRDPSAPVFTNPVYNTRFVLGGGFGFGQSAKFGELEFTVTTNRPDSAKEASRVTAARARADTAAAREQELGKAMEQASRDFLATRQLMYSYPEGSDQRVSIRLNDLPAADRRATETREAWQKAQKDAAAANRAAGPRKRPALRFGVSLRFDQGASIAEIVKLVIRISPAVVQHAQTWAGS